MDEGFRFIAENSRDVIMRIDMNLIYLYVSPASFDQLGWHPEEMVGKHVSSFVHSDDFHIVADVVTRTFSQRIDSDSVMVRAIHKNGSIVWVETSTRIVRNIADEPQEFVVILRDVTQRRALEERLRTFAMTDSLTELANRRAFDEALEREWKSTIRRGSVISLLLLDLDHFKEFNDTYGHQAGDDCLRAVAATLRTTVRQTDLAARYGGEELAVILPDTHASPASFVAEKVRCAVNALCLPHIANEEGLGLVTVTIGVATAYPCDGKTLGMPRGLLLGADMALYGAKQGGRNRVAPTLMVASLRG